MNSTVASFALEEFIARAAARSAERQEPADCVPDLAPLMLAIYDVAARTRKRVEVHHNES